MDLAEEQESPLPPKPFINWRMMGNYLFIVPALGMFITFSLYPFVDVFLLSVHDWDGITELIRFHGDQFVGLANFKDILFNNSVWWSSFKNAGYVTLLALLFQNTTALVLAWIVDRGVRGAQFYRSIFFLPPILSGVVVGLIWGWIFQADHGLLNNFLRAVGETFHSEWIANLARPWLADKDSALTSLAMVHMWKGFGWGFIILLAGLQGIPRELYEAARVDGASEARIFWKITFPLMIPVFVLVTVLTILGTMQLFDLVITTTGGGPGYHTEVPMTRIIKEISQSSRLGYACAMGVVFGLVLFVVSILQIHLSKRVKRD